MRLSLVAATILGVALVFAIGGAISDSAWAAKLQGFQILAGGLAALAAALVAHDAQSAAAREAKRKDDLDRKIVRHNLLIRTAMTARIIEGFLYDTLHDMSSATNGFSDRNLDVGTLVELPCCNLPDIKFCLENPAALPERAREPLRGLAHHMLFIADEITRFKAMKGSELAVWFRFAHLCKDAHKFALELYGILSDEISSAPSGAARRKLEEMRAKRGDPIITVPDSVPAKVLEPT